MATILLTGAAGFIGSWTAEALLKKGDQVVGIDNFNDYYDVQLKRDRIKKIHGRFKLYKANISHYRSLQKVFDRHRITHVCHLAAQAGVNYSLENPFIYENSNNLGTLNLLELCRRKKVKSFVYASSSSVYGGNKKLPFSESDFVDHPISFYAATKKFNELIAYTYSHLYGLRCTGLRLFTVYGPWGRPDMALFKFTKSILEGKTIELYNRGMMRRDFTYITDVVDGILKALNKKIPTGIFNIGNSTPVPLLEFVRVIEQSCGKKAKVKLSSLRRGDVPATYADIRKARRILGYQPKVKIKEGIQQFVNWFRSYYGL